MDKNLIPKIKKNISSFLLDEKGEISKSSGILLGALFSATSFISVEATHLCTSAGGGGSTGACSCGGSTGACACGGGSACACGCAAGGACACGSEGACACGTSASCACTASCACGGSCNASCGSY